MTTIHICIYYVIYILCSSTRVVSPNHQMLCLKCGFPFAIKSVDRKGLTDFRQLGEAEALLFTAGKHLGSQRMEGSEVSETGMIPYPPENQHGT